MKWLKILIGLILLAGIGVACWYFLGKEIPLPFLEKYPKQMAELRDEVGIEVNDQGFTTLVARQRNDLLFLQGYHHGDQYGAKLDQLRRLFKGYVVADLPKDLRDLATLFYYLDLERVAAKCEPLYSGTLQTLLSAYAEGLTKGSDTEVEPWTVRDVLLMQRGYAFLLGGNFTKEWCAERLATRFGAETFARCTNYPLKDFGALPQGIALDTSIAALMHKPLLEPVRLYDNRGHLAVNVRTHPYLSFVFEPMILELEDQLEARGLAMAGQPFLWAAQTAKLAFYRQPILADDEQFGLAPHTNSTDVEGYVVNEAASAKADHPDPPLEGPLGQKVSHLAIGPKDTDIFYRWDGFRPSADLAALYYLLQASTVDEAISAYQYHQVPATELTVITASRQVVNMQALPSDPRPDAEPQALFAGPFTRIGQRISSITSRHSRSEEAWQMDQLGKPGTSPLDQELMALLRFYLKGPIREESLDATTQEQLLALLGPQTEPARDAFVQMVWQKFFNLLEERHLDHASKPLTQGFPLECQRLVLTLYGREGRQEERSRGGQAQRANDIADILLSTWKKWNLARGSELGFLMPNARGRIVETHAKTFFPSADAAEAWFFVDLGNTITQVSCYSLKLDKDMDFYRYGFLKDQSLGRPQLVRQPEVESLTQIKPKI